jgi:iron complex outermembrane receptor protein
MVYLNSSYPKAIDAVSSGPLSQLKAFHAARCRVDRPLRPSLGKSVRWVGYLMIGGFALAAVSVPDLVIAQERNPAASADGLAEIVVTAERREETVQKTPISITAVTGEQLEARGITRLEDLASETPGISMKQFAPGQTEYEMRGLPSSGGSSATVGLYVDNVPLAASANSFMGKAAIDPDLFDLQRVEVLRGPQGTLYGAGSMGGTIRLITTPANSKEFEAAAQTDLSHTQHGGTNWGTSAMLNLPIQDNVLAVRLVGTDKYDHGFIDRIVVSPFPLGPGGSCVFVTCTRGDVASAPVVAKYNNYNWERLLGGRAAVRFTPNEQLTIDLLAMYQGIHLGGLSQTDTSVGIDQLDHYEAANVPDHLVDTFKIYSLNLNYDFESVTFTSTTAKWIHNAWWNVDSTELNESLYNTFYGARPFYPNSYLNSDHVQQLSEEARLTSRGDSRFQWVAGLFYSDLTSYVYQYDATPQLAYLSGGTNLNPQGVNYEEHTPYYLKQYAVFAEGSYKFTDQWKLTAGVRGFKYTAEQDLNVQGIFTATGNLTPTTGVTNTKSTGASPKVNLSYTPNDNTTWYAQIAKGFRPGGVNAPAPVALCGNAGIPSYGPDSIWDYEVGEKMRFLGGALQINADVFYIRWNNLQQLLTLPCSYPFSDNIGTGESYGPELEVTAKVSPYITLSVSGDYTTAKITSIDAALLGNTIGSTEQLRPGLPVLNVPKYSVTEAIDVAVPVSDGWKVTGRLSATTTGPFYDIDYYVEKLPSYTIADLRAGLTNGRFSSSLYLDNLTNKIAVLTIDTHSWNGAVPSDQQASVNRPRTVGLQLNYKF